MRMMNAATAVPSASAGKISVCNPSHGLSSRLTKPTGGSQCSTSETNRISMVPNRKLGMLKPNNASTRDNASDVLPRLAAEATPNGMATASAMTIDTTVNCRVTPKRLTRSGRTGRLVLRETPKSPCRTWLSQSTYWIGNGRSSPKLRRRVSICWSVACVPNNTCVTSPGIKCTSKNTSTEIPTNTGTRLNTRRATYCVIAQLVSAEFFMGMSSTLDKERAKRCGPHHTSRREHYLAPPNSSSSSFRPLKRSERSDAVGLWLEPRGNQALPGLVRHGREVGQLGRVRIKLVLVCQKQIRRISDDQFLRVVVQRLGLRLVW